MALEKRIETGAITVLSDGQLQVRTDTVILEDGTELARSFHRLVLDPATVDRATLTGRVRQVADALWTAAVVTARREAITRAEGERRSSVATAGRRTAR